MKRLFQRIYSDYFLSDRFGEYSSLLAGALVRGYQVVSVAEWYSKVSGAFLGPWSPRVLILRHDIDTDAAAARLFAEVEQSLGVRSSFYFRLSTVDVPLMRELHAAGFDVGYHYEEIAAIAKETGLATRQDVEHRLPEIRAKFAENIERLRKQTLLPLRTAASHGDFVNRILGCTNVLILDNPQFREQMNIDFEAYDSVIRDPVTSFFTDCQYPKFWRQGSPSDAIANGSPVIHILTHPRSWRGNLFANTVDNCRRAYEGFGYRIRRGRVSAWEC